MMSAKTQELERNINTLTDEVKGIWDEVDQKFNGEIDADRKSMVVAKNKEIESLELKLRDELENEQLRGDAQSRYERSRRPAGLPQPNGDQPKGKILSLGDMFLQSREWQDYFKALAPNGQFGANQRIESPKMALARSILAVVTGDSATSGGAFVTPDDSGIYETLGRRPLTLRDLISVRTTSSDLIEYVRMTSRTNNAAPVSEATATSGVSGTKPESDMAFERVNAPVETIAHWVAATKRALADAGQMRGLIDQELRQGLEEELEDQILNGDGTSPNLSGLDDVSGTQDQAWDTNILTTTRRARTLVRTVGRATPTGYVMHPNDWEDIDLLQDNEARYFFGGPSVIGNPRLWGLPVVETEAQTEGFAWVGDWRKIVLWDREQALISVSDSHLDFFVRNMVAILGEMRVALGIIRPSAFVEIDLTA